MKSEDFSGFDVFTAGGALRRQVLLRLGRERPHPNRLNRLAVAAVCLALVAAAAVLVGYRIFGGTVYAAKDYKIVNHSPILLPSGARSEASLAVAPTESSLYAQSDTIVYGRVTGFKWVVLQNERDAFSRYQTIVAVKILTRYSGSLAQGETADILLPVLISGTGGGPVTEDFENAALLKKGTEAFFFAHRYKDGDTVADGSSAIPAKKLCAYGTGWGDQYVLPDESGKFSYPFSENGTFDLSRKLNFSGVEAIISRRAG